MDAHFPLCFLTTTSGNNSKQWRDPQRPEQFRHGCNSERLSAHPREYVWASATERPRLLQDLQRSSAQRNPVLPIPLRTPGRRHFAVRQRPQVSHGVPWAAWVVAHRMPVEWHEQLGEGVMDSLDKFFMEPSELLPESRAGYREWFDEMAGDFESEHTYTLHFRSWKMGANALALPNGIVVVTDSLIDLISNREEFEAIVAHEIGHVIHRHAMQMALRDAGIFIFISAFLGDLASVSSLASAIPTILIESSYSRSLEKEADLVSGTWLQAKYGSTEPLKSILIKLHRGKGGVEIPELLSTHPDLKNRILLLEKTFPPTEGTNGED